MIGKLHFTPNDGYIMSYPDKKLIYRGKKGVKGSHKLLTVTNYVPLDITSLKKIQNPHSRIGDIFEFNIISRIEDNQIKKYAHMTSHNKYTPDSIVQTIIDKFITRAEFGEKKYGVTLDREDLSIEDYIQHALEEHMDAILYLQKVKTMLEQQRNG